MSNLRERVTVIDLTDPNEPVSYYYKKLPRRALGDITQHMDNKKNGGEDIVSRTSDAQLQRRSRRMQGMYNESPLRHEHIENISPSRVAPTSAPAPAPAAGRGLTGNEGYCVKCRQKRPMRNAHEITTKNHRKALQGACSVCGTKMMRFI
jgi:hypothetical protein